MNDKNKLYRVRDDEDWRDIEAEAEYLRHWQEKQTPKRNGMHCSLAFLLLVSAALTPVLVWAVWL